MTGQLDRTRQQADAFEAEIATRLRQLCDTPGQGPLAPRVELGQGAFLDFDPALVPGGRYAAPEGILADIDLRVGGAGGWAALHLPLGPLDLAPGATLALSARSQAAAPTLIRPCLRSGLGDGFADCFFTRHLLAAPQRLTWQDTLCAGADVALPAQAPWRELIFFMPPTGCHWVLEQLRVGLL